MADIIDHLTRVADPGNLIPGEALRNRSNGYWDNSPLRALALVTPKTTAELARILALCNHYRQPVVIQGGLTGAAGGQNAGPDEVAISLEKMRTIGDFDSQGKTLSVEAGCTLQEVQEFALNQGVIFPLDIGARGSCTIGGNIATNAGGMEVLRYGMMREQVLGLTAVLADGTVVDSLNSLQKNNAGYDLKHLFIGSEGTLGVVTQAVLRLRPLPAGCDTALVACASFDRISDLLQSAQQALGDKLTRFEVMDGNYFRTQTAPGNHRAPMAAHFAWYAIVESRGFSPAADSERFEQWLAACLNDAIAEDIVIPQNQRQAELVWQIREQFDAVIAAKPCFLYDVSLPIRSMADYIASLRKKVTERWPHARLHTLGHMGDGNLHFFLSPNEADQVAEAALKRTADALVYSPLGPLRGSVSAEHGIGLDKKAWLKKSRTDQEITVMKALKRQFDPNNILNPGRIFDL